MQQISEFTQTVEQMKRLGFEVPKKTMIRVPDAHQLLANAMFHFLGGGFQWLPEYDQVADWLTDNKGTGLFMYGQNGRGKTVLAQRVLPAIFLQYFNLVLKVVNAQQMNSELESLLKKRVVSLDDVGTEDVRMNYGERCWAFPEIIDSAEKKGHLVVITTNLGRDEIAQKYGIRTLERIKSTTTRILFKGVSMRK
jgi:DNA replication protein DnaC